MRGWIVADEATATRVLAAIDQARGPTETQTVIRDGRVVETREVPARPWGTPRRLRAGGALVPTGRAGRLAAIEGTTVEVAGTPTRIPTGAEAADVAEGDLEPRGDAAGGAGATRAR